MQKRHFETVAAALARASRLCETENQRLGVKRAAGALADAFAQENPLFNRARFLIAAGAMKAEG